MEGDMALPQHVQYMEEAFDHLVCYEDGWDQQYWRVGSQTSSCGTAMCYAGWGASIYGYRPVIPDPLKFADMVGDLSDGHYDIEIFALISVPRESAPPNLREVDKRAYFSSWDPDVVAYWQKLMDSVPEDHVVTTVENLASAIFNVQTGDNPNGTLDGNVFEWTNTLSMIRWFIDRARDKDGLEPRDFATEPVMPRIDDGVPVKRHGAVRRRAKAFNKRAALGVIRTVDAGK